ncbi:MAG: hypothetical protein JEY94_07285 [Melioribacteraceae bacterium]|nr:hypothetical protein [Melioribacteraceae bacterium]
MRKFIILLLFISVTIIFSQSEKNKIPGFYISPYFNEQVVSFNYSPEIEITINAPSLEKFNSEKPVSIILYALPNGNTTEQTIGKDMEEGDDWHFNIQHIGAQTRFLRELKTDENIVVVYLENELKSWPAWKAKYQQHDKIIKELVNYIREIFSPYKNSIVITGHSGGGRFTFSFIDAYKNIPDFVKRISFLDSNYGYETKYGEKLVTWLNSNNENYLSTFAYNDSIALYKGKRFVSDTGGTWYRTKMMQKFLAESLKFKSTEDTSFIKHESLEGRVKLILKKNPDRKILHTVQVELNGFIHAMLTGTEYENRGYEYYGERAYTKWIQKEKEFIRPLKIPPRLNNAISGSGFMNSISNLDFEAREKRILKEISEGNIPDFLRKLSCIESEFKDADGNIHSVKYKVMPDYLAIGSDEDFCRIPMGPIIAQKIADLFGASLPTPKFVDDIYKHADVKLEPQFYTPVENQNELVSKFILHNRDIEAQRKKRKCNLGQLTSGIKKDIVICSKLSDTTRTHHVTIYGWHKLEDGKRIQPVYNGHIDSYVDYSHGIRLIKSEVVIDSKIMQIGEVLRDSILYKVFSNEDKPLNMIKYKIK